MPGVRISNYYSRSPLSQGYALSACVLVSQCKISQNLRRHAAYKVILRFPILFGHSQMTIKHVCELQSASMEPRHSSHVASCLDFVAPRLAPFDEDGLCGHNGNFGVNPRNVKNTTPRVA